MFAAQGCTEGDTIVAEVDGSGQLVAEYVWGLLEPIVRIDYLRPENTRYYVIDGLGHVRALVASNGAITEVWHYDSWGNPISPPAQRIDQPFLWNGAYGYEYIPFTGLYHIGAREYDPRTARWLQRDPIDVAGRHPMRQEVRESGRIPFLTRGEEDTRMKIQLNRKQFDDALGVVAGAAAARASLPILSHLYIEAQSDTVRLVGSDLEQWVECRIPAMVGEDGATTLPARLLTDLVGSLGGEDIHIESGERYQAVLTSGDSRYQLMGLPAEEYPPIPDIESPSELALPAKHFLEMVGSVEFAVSKEEARQALTGIRMEFEGDTLRLVATDTHRLAVRTARIDSGAGEPTAAIVPLKAIQLVQKIPAGETITLQLGQHRAAFLGENAAVYTQLIEGQYPNYQRVIPQEFTRQWTLMTQDFRNALRRAYLVARSNSNKVYLRTDGEKLVISARGDVGEATERVDLIRTGDDLEIAFNARYLLDVLEVVKSEGVVLELTEALRPAVLKPAEMDDYLCVIMPMAL